MVGRVAPRPPNRIAMLSVTPGMAGRRFGGHGATRATYLAIWMVAHEKLISKAAESGAHPQIRSSRQSIQA